MSIIDPSLVSIKLEKIEPPSDEPDKNENNEDNVVPTNQSSYVEPHRIYIKPDPDSLDFDYIPEKRIKIVKNNNEETKEEANNQINLDVRKIKIEPVIKNDSSKGSNISEVDYEKEVNKLIENNLAELEGDKSITSSNHQIKIEKKSSSTTTTEESEGEEETDSNKITADLSDVSEDEVEEGELVDELSGEFTCFGCYKMGHFVSQCTKEAKLEFLRNNPEIARERAMKKNQRARDRRFLKTLIKNKTTKIKSFCDVRFP